MYFRCFSIIDQLVSCPIHITCEAQAALRKMQQEAEDPDKAAQLEAEEEEKKEKKRARGRGRGRGRKGSGRGRSKKKLMHPLRFLKSLIQRFRNLLKSLHVVKFPELKLLMKKSKFLIRLQSLLLLKLQPLTG